MKTTTTLTCKFKDTLGKSRLINVDAPAEPIDEIAVQAFMQAALDLDVLVPDSNNSEVKLAAVDSASLITKMVEELSVTE